MSQIFTQATVAAIKEALERVEAETLRLRKILSGALVHHGPAMGLSGDEIAEFSDGFESEGD